MPPQADSPQCRDISAAFPDKASGFRKVDVREPAPAGATAYRNEQGVELTIRCGVNAPDQFTQASITEDHEGTQWLPIKDATPGSNLSTYYTVGAGPVLAITSEADFSGALDDFSSAIASHTDAAAAPERKPYPMSTQQPAKQANEKVCREFLSTLPDKLGDYSRVGSDDPAAAQAPALFGNISRGSPRTCCGALWARYAQWVQGWGTPDFRQRRAMVRGTEPSTRLHQWKLVGPRPGADRGYFHARCSRGQFDHHGGQ